MKRKNEYGQLSREEYDEDTHDYSSEPYPGSYSIATPGTLSTRRIVTAAHRVDQKKVFARHLYALNTSFHKWFKEQVAKDPTASLIDGAQDYIDHITQLENRYLPTYGEVLTFGSGDCGQLAHGMDSDEDTMVKFPRIVYSLRDKKVCNIACGGLHNAVLTETGQVYTWGCADDGSLGRVGTESIPHLVEKLKDFVVVSLACGDGQTLAVTTTGEVWGWGCYKDKEGKKFFNPTEQAIASGKPWTSIRNHCAEPILIQGLAGKNVIDVACGAAFCLCRCSDGSLYSWGMAECGELGRKVCDIRQGDGENVTYDLEGIHRTMLTPGFMYKVKSGSEDVELSKAREGVDYVVVRDAKSIGCGSYHTLVVEVGGTVLSCGLNNYSQLGLGGTKPRSLLHTIQALAHVNVISVKGGTYHTLILTSEHKMLTFGRSDYAQLGISRPDLQAAGAFSEEPVEPVLPAGVEVIDIACGGHHNLALTSTHEVYSWGYGDMLALGHGDDKDEPVPKKLNFSKAKLSNMKVSVVAGGGQHSALIAQVAPGN